MIMESTEEQLESYVLDCNKTIVDDLELTDEHLQAVAGFAITPTLIIITTIFQ